MEPKQLRLLIVDDEPMLRSVIQEYLNMIGYEHFATAGDGREALGVIRSQPVDCMISDLRMPEMELEEVLDVVRKEFPDLTVIATSGYSDFTTSSNILRKGADDFLEKPLNFDLLERALLWIEHRLNMSETARKVFTAAALEGPAAVNALLAPLRAALEQSQGVFTSAMQHSARIAQLVVNLAPAEWPAEELRLLGVSAALHELGLSCQLFQLCQQPRRLEEMEYHLILYSVETHAHVTARRIGQPGIEPIIAHHLEWVNAPSVNAGEPLDKRGPIWLGIANSIDGFLQDRPDRPRTSLPGVREWLERRHKRQANSMIALWLDQWPRVEAFYKNVGMA